MVESVDTQDLKSCDHSGCVGSSPAPSTGLKNKRGFTCVLKWILF